MRARNHRFRFFDKVLIVEDAHFNDFPGMVVRKEPRDFTENGNRKIGVSVGYEEDVILGLGAYRIFEASQLKYLGKNLRREFEKAKKRHPIFP
jgi:hypothetical protein